MSHLAVLIVEKNGTLKSLTIKDYKEEELYKKCGFKKADNFNLQTQWVTKINGQKLVVSMYGKLDGRANTENKYDFPPPIDTKLYFGNCVLVAMICDTNNERSLCDLTNVLWNTIYEKLFGGFDNLQNSSIDDEDEEDELEHVASSKKTKIGGYLKDDFIVDEDEDEDEDNDSFLEQVSQPTTEDLDEDEGGSELVMDSYDYSDEN